MSTLPRVVGVGNLMRRDDGAGPIAIRRLEALHAPSRRFTTSVVPVDAAAIVEALRGAADVHLVDAVRSGGPAGEVFRIDARHGGSVRFRGSSTHALGVDEAVRLAESLGELPRKLVLWGVAGADFGIGEGLSAAVDRGVDDLVRRLAVELCATQIG